MNQSYSLQLKSRSAGPAQNLRAMEKLSRIGAQIGPVVLIVCVVAIVLSLAFAAVFSSGQ